MLLWPRVLWSMGSEFLMHCVVIERMDDCACLFCEDLGAVSDP
jgi:hypothetical protein